MGKRGNGYEAIKCGLCYRVVCHHLLLLLIPRGKILCGMLAFASKVNRPM
jgi:hypothetical protein